MIITDKQLRALQKVHSDNADYLGSLKDRWEDECMFEEFADYISAVKESFQLSGAKFVKMTKNFTVTFIIENVEGIIQVGKKQITLSYKVA